MSGGPLISAAVNGRLTSVVFPRLPQGSDQLTVSWKVTDDVIQHIAVKEVGKENAFSLGQTLMIGESGCRGDAGGWGGRSRVVCLHFEEMPFRFIIVRDVGVCVQCA